MIDTTGRNNRRKRRRGIAIVATAIAAASPIIVLGVANAAQGDPDLLADCLRDSSALQECNYVEVSSSPDQLGVPQRVSTILNNCGNTIPANKSFDWTVTVSRSVESERGVTGALGGSAEGSVAAVAAKHTGGDLRIHGGAESFSGSNKISGDVEPDRQGFVMFQRKSFASIGYLHGVYKEAVNGKTEFDYPEGGALAPEGPAKYVKIFFPQLLTEGIPDGRIWLRNAPCGETVEAADNLETAGFGEISGVTDIELTP